MKISSRRGFFRGILRAMLAAASAALTWLATRPGLGATAHGRCKGGGICRFCEELEGCGRPQALSCKMARGLR